MNTTGHGIWEWEWELTLGMGYHLSLFGTGQHREDLQYIRRCQGQGQDRLLVYGIVFHFFHGCLFLSSLMRPWALLYISKRSVLFRSIQELNGIILRQYHHHHLIDRSFKDRNPSYE